MTTFVLAVIGLHLALLILLTRADMRREWAERQRRRAFRQSLLARRYK